MSCYLLVLECSQAKPRGLSMQQQLSLTCSWMFSGHRVSGWLISGANVQVHFSWTLWKAQSPHSPCLLPDFPPSFTRGPCSVPYISRRNHRPHFCFPSRHLNTCSGCTLTQKCLLYLKGCLCGEGVFLQLIYPLLTNTKTVQF